MKRFNFSLKPVATLRSHRELRAREALAASIPACAQAEENLSMVRTRLARLELSLAARRNTTLRAAEGTAFFQFYRRECALEIEAKRRVAAAGRELEKSREAYLEANRQVKVVTRLEQRARAAHRLAVLAAEQVEIDEIAGRCPGRPLSMT